MRESMSKDIRPYGVSIDEHDESHSTIFIYDPDGKISMVSDGSTTTDSIRTHDGEMPFMGLIQNFILQEVAEKSQEHIKIQQSFGDYWNAFFFGSAPEVVMFKGAFLDSKNFTHYQEFVQIYESHMRGTNSVKNKLRIVITYDGKWVEGYFMGLDYSTSIANSNKIKTFMFSVIARKKGWMRYNKPDTLNTVKSNQSNKDYPEFIAEATGGSNVETTYLPVRNSSAVLGKKNDLPESTTGKSAGDGEQYAQKGTIKRRSEDKKTERKNRRDEINDGVIPVNSGDWKAT